MKVNDICQYLNNHFPESNASDMDKGKIGLIFGSYNYELKNVLLALDLSIDVVNEAINNNCNLIIIHHPYLFKPISKIIDEQIIQVIRLLFAHNVSVYAMHTNYDCSLNGVNDSLAEYIGLTNIHFENIEGDIMPKKDMFLRVGKTNKQKLEDFANSIKRKFLLKSVKVVGDLNKEVENVGIIGGSGSDYTDIDRAISKKCDVYISSEFSYHVAQYAFSKGLCLIDVNHSIEKYAFIYLKRLMDKQFKIKIFISQIDPDPLQIF